MRLPIKFLVIFLVLFFFSFIHVDNVLACDTTNFLKRNIDYPSCALVENCTPDVWNTTVTYTYRNQEPCTRVEYFSTSTCADGSETFLRNYTCNINRGCTVAGGECSGTGNSICVMADYNDTNSMCAGIQPTSFNRNSNVCKIINCGNYCDTTNYSCQIKYAQQGQNVGTSATNVCQTTNSTALGYCAAPASTTAPPPGSSPTPIPAPAPPPPAGSCTVTDQYWSGPAGADCDPIATATGNCTCGYTATFNYTTSGTCNRYDAQGRQFGQQVYTFVNVTCTAPPPPNCDSGRTCNDCADSGAPIDTCHTGNSSAACTYTTHTSGVSCTEVPAPAQVCTINNCSASLRCEQGICVGIRPWIQTTGGDVHSQIRINLPGGP